MRWTVTVFAFLAVILAAPSVCHAHALHPAYYPLGPYVLLLPLSAPVALVPLFVVVGINAAVLRGTVSKRRMSGTLLGAGVVFVVSKAGESVPGLVILRAAPWVMWSSDSTWATLWAPLLLFGVGVLANAALIGAMFRKAWSRTVGIAAVLSVVSYVAVLSSTLGMLRLGWVR